MTPLNPAHSIAGRGLEGQCSDVDCVEGSNPCLQPFSPHNRLHAIHASCWMPGRSCLTAQLDLLQCHLSPCLGPCRDLETLTLPKSHPPTPSAQQLAPPAWLTLSSVRAVTLKVKSPLPDNKAFRVCLPTTPQVLGRRPVAAAGHLAMAPGQI